jgi:hypothetical protein
MLLFWDLTEQNIDDIFIEDSMSDAVILHVKVINALEINIRTCLQIIVTRLFKNQSRRCDSLCDNWSDKADILNFYWVFLMCLSARNRMWMIELIHFTDDDDTDEEIWDLIVMWKISWVLMFVLFWLIKIQSMNFSLTLCQ